MATISQVGIGSTSQTTVGALSVGSLATGFIVATQAIQETGTSLTAPVVPGTQQFHQSSAKGWVMHDFAGTIIVSYNVTSITDAGTGVGSVIIATDFSTANFVVCATNKTDSGSYQVCVRALAVGSFDFYTSTNSDTPAESGNNLYSFFGDQ